METTFIWLTTATADGLLSTRTWTFSFHCIQIFFFLNSWEPLSFSRRTVFRVLGHLRSRIIVLICKITRGGLGTFSERFAPTLWPLRTELDLLQCSYLVHTAAKQAVSTKQFVSTLCWLQASRKQADGDALICKFSVVHRSVSVPEREGKLFAIWLELRTNLGASVPLCPFHLRSQHSFPCFSLFISCIPFPSTGGRWALYEYMCSPENNLILCLYSSQLFIETIAAMHHSACTTLDPSTVARSDANAVPRAVSRVKHHQEEAEAYIRSSCPGSEGFRRGWEYFEDKEGLKHCVPHVKPNL